MRRICLPPPVAATEGKVLSATDDVFRLTHTLAFSPYVIDNPIIITTIAAPLSSPPRNALVIIGIHRSAVPLGLMIILTTIDTITIIIIIIVAPLGSIIILVPSTDTTSLITLVIITITITTNMV